MSDPFAVLNEDIHRFVLQHLDFCDVLKGSLVSQFWYHTIGSSRECTDKLIYSIDTEHQMRALTWSLRQYEHFKVIPFNLREVASVILNFKVKSMRINELYGKKIEHSDYINFIESFARTVEYLTFCDVTTENSNRTLRVVDFCKLKKLHFTYTNRTALWILLGNNPQLNHVVISSNNLSAHDEEEFLRHDNVIIKFLRKNNKIKELCLLNLEHTFLYDISLCINTIQSFTFTTNFMLKSTHVRDNFLKFLSAQPNLEKIHVMCCQNKRILVDIWNSAKSVKHFIIDCNIHEDISSSDLQKNSFIEEIDFYLTSSLIVIFFLRASPNIKYLKVRQLSKYLLEHCLQLVNLEVITFQSIDPDAYSFYKKNINTVNSNKFRLIELDFFEYLNIRKRR